MHGGKVGMGVNDSGATKSPMMLRPTQVREVLRAMLVQGTAQDLFATLETESGRFETTRWLKRQSGERDAKR